MEFWKGIQGLGVLVLIRKITCARRSYVRLVNQIFGILRRSSTLEAIRFWSTFTLAICIYSWVLWLLVFGCITRPILVSYYTVLHYRISIICLFSHFVLACICVHSIPPLLLFALLVSGQSFFKKFKFFLSIDTKITYLHFALTEIQCILACTTCVNALLAVLQRLICFSYIFVCF